MQPRADRGITRENARTLSSAVFVVLAVCAIGLLSIRPAAPKTSAAASGKAAVETSPMVSFASGGIRAPQTFLADIRSFGWRDKSRNLLDIKVDSAKLVAEVDARTGEARGETTVSPLSDRFVGQRVLAVVDPAAARDVQTPGTSVVQMVVIPDRDTMQLSIARVVPSRGRRTRLGLITSGSPSAPKVTGLSTHAAGPGSEVRVTGTGFGPTQSDSWPIVCGVRATATSWSDTGVTFIVPTGLERSGYVGVVVGGVTSNGSYFTPFNAPVLDAVTPRQGGAGSQVTFEGHDFGATQGDGWVSFSGAAGHVVSWSDTKVVAVVPKDAVSGYAGVIRHGLSSNGRLFSPYGYPGVTSLSTQNSLAGSTVTIYGTDFGPAPGEAIFGGVAQSVVSWSNTQVTFKAPSSAGAAYVGVRRVGGLTSNGIFMVVGPRLTGLSRWWGPAGTEIEVTGEGFGSAQGQQQVTFNHVAGDVVSWSATRLRVKVPAAGTSGYVGVGVPPGTSNGIHFTVVSQAHVDAVDKTTVWEGDTITITGTDFGGSPSSAKVTIAYDSACTVQSWSDTRIVATVAAGAKSGYLGVVKQGVASNGIWLSVR